MPGIGLLQVNNDDDNVTGCKSIVLDKSLSGYQNLIFQISFPLEQRILAIPQFSYKRLNVSSHRNCAFKNDINQKQHVIPYSNNGKHKSKRQIGVRIELRPEDEDVSVFMPLDNALVAYENHFYYTRLEPFSDVTQSIFVKPAAFLSLPANPPTNLSMRFCKSQLKEIKS